MSSLPVQPLLDATPVLRIRRTTVAEYQQMLRDGYFAENERFELLDGLLVEKMPKNPPHAVVTTKLVAALYRLALPDAHVRVQEPITCERSEPEPDVVVARGAAADYLAGHPTPAQVLLLVEVADSTLDIDRGIKLREYASEGISPYYLLNIPDRCVERYSRPSAGAYLDRDVIRPGERLEFVIGSTPFCVEVSTLFEGLPV